LNRFVFSESYLKSLFVFNLIRSFFLFRGFLKNYNLEFSFNSKKVFNKTLFFTSSFTSSFLKLNMFYNKTFSLVLSCNNKNLIDINKFIINIKNIYYNYNLNL
jgi:hypothetical protein